MGAEHRTSDEGRAANPVWNSEVTWMEHRRNEARGQIEDGGRKQDPGHLGVVSDDPWSGEDNRFAKAAPSWSTGAQGSGNQLNLFLYQAQPSGALVSARPRATGWPCNRVRRVGPHAAMAAGVGAS